jgi:hypothetical protein
MKYFPVLILFVGLMACARETPREGGTILDEPTEATKAPLDDSSDFLANAVSDSSVIKYRHLDASELEEIFNTSRGATAELALFDEISVALVMGRKSTPSLGVTSVNGSISSPNVGDWAISVENGRYAGSVHLRSLNKMFRIVSSPDASKHVLMHIDLTKVDVLPGGTIEVEGETL